MDSSPSPSNDTPETNLRKPEPEPELSTISATSTDAVAKGFSTTLASLIRDFDSKSRDALLSQDRLASAIDRLTGELDKLLEDAPVPFIMQHAAKISGVRKRVSSLNLLLRSIQDRIDNVDRMLSAGVSQEKVSTENS